MRRPFLRWLFRVKLIRLMRCPRWLSSLNYARRANRYMMPYLRSSLRRSSLLERARHKMQWLRLWLEVAEDLRDLDKALDPVRLLAAVDQRRK